MKIVSRLHDARINAQNILMELNIEEYRNLVSGVLENNQYQRKRVQSSKTVYALLKNDLMKQCVIPPIVLALTSTSDFDAEDSETINNLREQKDKLVILDGLQRTYTIFELLDELRIKNDEDALKKVLQTKIRLEIYLGINRIGILYRMLTLNTGQTPMSLRHQIEMLYLDYLDTSVGNIELIRESDQKSATELHQFNFKDIIEGFNAYLDRDELPIDKADILENINSLEKLSKENQASQIFEKYLSSFSSFVITISNLADGIELSEEYLQQHDTPFGKNVLQIFKKPQAMSGFGAAVGNLVDRGVIQGFENITQIISGITLDDASEFLESINGSLNWIKLNTKKIGNAQRSFFRFFFQDLFNFESDSHKNLISASKTALRKYQSQM